MSLRPSLSMLAALLLLGSPTVASADVTRGFTIPLVPLVRAGDTGLLYRSVEWCAGQRTARDIALVIGIGDSCGLGRTLPEVDTAFARLDRAGQPYGVCSPDTVRLFPSFRLAALGYPVRTTALGEGMERYDQLVAPGFVVVYIQRTASAADTAHWLDDLLVNVYPDRRAIVVVNGLFEPQDDPIAASPLGSALREVLRARTNVLLVLTGDGAQFAHHVDGAVHVVSGLASETPGFVRAVTIDPQGGEVRLETIDLESGATATALEFTFDTR